MVKFILQRTEFDYKGRLQTIVATVEYNRFPLSFKTVTRTWTIFCDEIRRRDVISEEKNTRYYIPEKTLAKRQIQKLSKEKSKEEHIKSKEERRQGCKCKPKCMEEFICDIKEEKVSLE
ncbi:MAG: hypothetical protein GY834_02240 [Bacteroidetes bacterium]|nr:hypothetical protein [Bacteroidota bacterium]